jgi:hypothetical protein
VPDLGRKPEFVEDFDAVIVPYKLRLLNVRRTGSVDENRGRRLRRPLVTMECPA